MTSEETDSVIRAFAIFCNRSGFIGGIYRFGHGFGAVFVLIRIRVCYTLHQFYLGSKPAFSTEMPVAWSRFLAAVAISSVGSFGGIRPYNLACYRAVSGMVAEAKTLLAEAFTL